jgi:ATP-dependent Clp protease ATP-binding subunit ClpA
MAEVAEDAKRVLENARALAAQKGHEELDPIHVAHVLFHEEGSVGQVCLFSDMRTPEEPSNSARPCHPSLGRATHRASSAQHTP